MGVVEDCGPGLPSAVTRSATPAAAAAAPAESIVVCVLLHPHMALLLVVSVDQPL